VGLAVPLLALAVSGGLLYLSDVHLRLAREAKADGDPQRQLDEARSAESLSPTAVEPLYLQASALETLGAEGDAREALREALEREPGNFVTLALLGDLEVRGSDVPDARRYYQAAHELNPLDTGLNELADIGD
jgi:Flp pilus assembly protein TadD